MAPNAPREIEGPRARAGCVAWLIAALVLLFAIRELAVFTIDYQWWREMGQMETWFSQLLYQLAPVAAAAVLAFAVLWITHARALKFAGLRLSRYPLYARLSTVVLLALSILIALSTIDTWAVARYFGARSLDRGPQVWRDPVFGHPLPFYLFDLPFYSVALNLLLAIAVCAAILYWVAARVWQLRGTFSEWNPQQGLNLRDLRLIGALESRFVRVLGAVFLLSLAARFYLSRYHLLLNEHGFMVGIDYVDQYFGLPLQWFLIACCVLGAASVLARQPRGALLVIAALLLRAIAPAIVEAAYVRPNEISLERPFIDRHIHATRAAYGIDSRTREIEVQARPDSTVDFGRHKALLDNVRLWDWRAFHETLSQIQPLRPYVYSDTDVDRYTIGGRLRQVLLAPRELDLNGLGEARGRWINPHLIYTHGYGVVMAEANQITANGLPVLFIKDAPPEISVPDLKLARPEIYFSELAHDPVFVRTAQPEFNYPAGEHNVQTRYDGRGGFPISSLLTRAAAAISRGDWNILLTGNLTPESRMMIHRRILDRLDTLANFVLWDADPYMVLGPDGRLVWMVDGYMTAANHPYSRIMEFEGAPAFNYIRNSVKATIDAYDGTVHLYVFDPSDPLIAAYRNLFPHLFEDASAMPADLRKHVRYPETIFRAQAEIYRLFHMRDPDTFYNNSDAWDITKFTTGQTTTPQTSAPSYMVAILPGETEPEFLLVTSFTPRNRDNLIGVMLARCDGPKLGEKVVLLLSKQQIVLGPMQVEARINQDQNISKDLTLWNQQGSQVLRGQMLVLPIENTFLYVEPIYLQASQAKMPQLKKVALAVGNTIAYADTYEQALAQLSGGAQQTPQTPSSLPAGQQTPTQSPVQGLVQNPGQSPVQGNDARLTAIRQHLQRYRELVSQGKLSEAGRELEAIQNLAER